VQQPLRRKIYTVFPCLGRKSSRKGEVSSS
jgi:hypothetical protein